VNISKKKLGLFLKITLVENVQHIYTGAVYDVLRAMGYPNQVLPNDIRALDKGQRITGKVFTIEGRREVWRTENKVRKAILEGTDPVEAYLAYGKF
jgi:hypothetical protein